VRVRPRPQREVVARPRALDLDLALNNVKGCMCMP